MEEADPPTLSPGYEQEGLDDTGFRRALAPVFEKEEATSLGPSLFEEAPGAEARSRREEISQLGLGRAPAVDRGAVHQGGSGIEKSPHLFHRSPGPEGLEAPQKRFGGTKLSLPCLLPQAAFPEHGAGRRLFPRLAPLREAASGDDDRRRQEGQGRKGMPAHSRR